MKIRALVAKTVLSFVLFFSTHFYVLGAQSTQNLSNRDKLIGNIVKNALETYHYRDLKIDDKVSKKAFVEYLKRLDFGKQFLLKSDVEELKKQQLLMDDQMTEGRYDLITLANSILKKRMAFAQNYRKEFFKTSISFKEKESFEIDPEKRDYVKNEQELKDLWRKLFKQSVLNRYISLLEDQNTALEEEKAKKEGKSKEVSKGKSSDKSKNKKSIKPFKKQTEAEMIKTAMEAISDKYKRLFERLAEEDHDDHLEKFINAVAAIYDPHTDYLPPRKKEDFDIDISGSLEGIGAVLQEEGAFIKVVQIVPGGAAWRQKELEVDDIILMVAQGDKAPVDLTNMRVDDAVRYIRGKKGSEVRLTVKKVDGSRRVIPIVRDVVQLGASFAKSSVLKLKNVDAKIGYIYLPKFYRDFNGTVERNCTQDVKNELERLKKYKVDAIILDLRNNGGGALEDARQMSGLFIEKGPIVQIRSHTGEIEVLADNDPSIVYDGPLIVMTNRFSASASEIVAAAMQDYNRAVLVGGEYSHGKGTVQAVVNLNQGPFLQVFGGSMGAIKVTIQKFYRVNGGSTQYKGVTPDIILPDPMSYSKSREQDLDYSLEWDAVPAKDYVSWKKANYDLVTLKDKSQKRLAKNTRFKKINESIEWLKKRQNETVVSLNVDDVLKEEKENKAISTRLKLDEENKDLDISHYEESLRATETIAPGDEKKWQEDVKQMSEDWTKALRQDAMLEETIHIADDMVKARR